MHAAFEENQTAEISVADWTVRNRDTGAVLQRSPVPERLLALMTGGGIYPLLEAEGLIAPKAAVLTRQLCFGCEALSVSGAAGGG